MELKLSCWNWKQQLYISATSNQPYVYDYGYPSRTLFANRVMKLSSFLHKFTTLVISMVKNSDVNCFYWTDTNNMFKLKKHPMFPRTWLVRLTSCRDFSFDNYNDSSIRFTLYIVYIYIYVFQIYDLAIIIIIVSL